MIYSLKVIILIFLRENYQISQDFLHFHTSVNYHRWDVCKAAVLLGEKENVPVYKFLREPLIRKFGEDWYRELEIAVDELKKQGLL